MLQLMTAVGYGMTLQNIRVLNFAPLIRRKLESTIQKSS